MEKDFLMKRSTSELRKLLKDNESAKERWENVKKQAAQAFSGTPKLNASIEKSIALHASRASTIKSIIVAREAKQKSAKQKKVRK
jgi:hypothetical protein